MGFINEKISEEDAKKYNFETLSKLLYREVWQLKQGWTIDRDKNIFLIWLGSGQEEFFIQNKFLLWWDGQVITFSINCSGQRDQFGKRITTWDSPGFELPDDLKPTRDEVISTSKDALTVFKWAGYGGQAVDHVAIFNF